MSNSPSILTNFENLIKAAESESLSMIDSTDINNDLENDKKSETLTDFNSGHNCDIHQPHMIESIQSNDSNVVTDNIPVNQVEIVPKIMTPLERNIIYEDDDLPKITPINSNSSTETRSTETRSTPLPDIKSSLNNANIGEALSKLSKNPDEVSKLMEQSAGQVTPQMMEEARKLAMGSQGQHILKEMKRRGMDPHSMRSQALQQQRALKGMASKTGEMKRCVLITGGRQLKMRNIPIGSEQISAVNIVGTDNPVELSCSRLASGPLEGKSIKIWCDTKRKGKNRRLTKILGFPIAGEGLIIMTEGDLTEADFLAAEKLLE
jgi:hypothetical protein